MPSSYRSGNCILLLAVRMGPLSPSLAPSFHSFTSSLLHSFTCSMPGPYVPAFSLPRSLAPLFPCSLSPIYWLHVSSPRESHLSPRCPGRRRASGPCSSFTTRARMGAGRTSHHQQACREQPPCRCSRLPALAGGHRRDRVPRPGTRPLALQGRTRAERSPISGTFHRL